ncbi:MAG: hypothetical protein IPK13_20105 [Deltaproteobacteria bacterium]|nr:hypothetical protein [Deltaproteobacteria bacterium]
MLLLPVVLAPSAPSAVPGNAARGEANRRRVEVYSVDLTQAVLATRRGAAIKAALDLRRAQLQASIDLSREALEGKAATLSRQAYDEWVDRIDRDIDAAEQALAREESAQMAPIIDRIERILGAAQKAQQTARPAIPRVIIETSVGQLLGKTSACDRTSWLTVAVEESDERPDAADHDDHDDHANKTPRPTSQRTCVFACLATVDLDALLPRFGPAQKAKLALDALRDDRQKDLDERARSLTALESRTGLPPDEREVLERKRRALALRAQAYQQEILDAETTHKAQVLVEMDAILGRWARRHNAVLLRYSPSMGAELPGEVTRRAHDATAWLMEKRLHEDPGRVGAPDEHPHERHKVFPSWAANSPCDLGAP